MIGRRGVRGRRGAGGLARRRRKRMEKRPGGSPAVPGERRRLHRIVPAVRRPRERFVPRRWWRQAGVILRQPRRAASSERPARLRRADGRDPSAARRRARWRSRRARARLCERVAWVMGWGSSSPSRRDLLGQRPWGAASVGADRSSWGRESFASTVQHRERDGGSYSLFRKGERDFDSRFTTAGGVVYPEVDYTPPSCLAAQRRPRTYTNEQEAGLYLVQPRLPTSFPSRPSRGPFWFHAKDAKKTKDFILANAVDRSGSR